MANRYDFYFRQLVQEDELDNPFTGLENADRALSTDLQLCRDNTNPAEYGGITYGFNASFLGLNVTHTPGKAYDEEGRRIATTANLAVTVTNMGNTQVGQGGTPDGGSTAPAAGQERWLTIYILFDRKPTDERHDGYDELVYFSRPESFYFHVEAGPAAVIGGTLTKPARMAGAILLTDVRYQNSPSTGLHIAEISQERKELFFNVAATAYPNITVARGDVRAALKDLLGHINNHVGGSAYEHPATAITYSGGTTWADGTNGSTGIATDVHMALQAIVTDLKASSEVAGAKRIGAKALTGTLATPSASATSLSAGTLESQLTALLTALNGKVFRGGDPGLAGTFTPSADGGAALGTASPAKRFDAALRDVSIASILSSLLPASDATYNLGSNPGHRWNNIYAVIVNADAINVSGAAIGSASISYLISHLRPDADATHDLGAALSRWRDVYTGTVDAATSITTPSLSADAILPKTDITGTLGSDVLAWDRLHARSAYCLPKNFSLDECGAQWVTMRGCIRSNSTNPLAASRTDALGLIDNNFGHFSRDLIAPIIPGAAYTADLFAQYFCPLTLEVPGAGAVAKQFKGAAGLYGTLLDVHAANSQINIQYGTSTVGGFFRPSDGPAIGAVFTPSEPGDVSKLQVSITLRTTDGTQYAEVYFYNSGCLMAVNDSTGLHPTHTLTTNALALNVRYVIRLCMLAPSIVYASLIANGIFVAGYSYSGLSFSAKDTCIEVSARNLTGDADCAGVIVHHIGVQTATQLLSRL